MTEQAQNIVVIDGVIVDENGEILGVAKQDFAINDLDSLNWLLGKLGDMQGEITKNSLRIEAYIDRLQAQNAAIQRRIDWLILKYGAQIQAFAASQLEGQKTRTLVTDEGRVSFRKTAGSIKVVEPERAAAWAEEVCPDAVKVAKSVLVSKIPDGTPLPPEAFSVNPPSDSVTLELGTTQIPLGRVN